MLSPTGASCLYRKRRTNWPCALLPVWLPEDRGQMLSLELKDKQPNECSSDEDSRPIEKYEIKSGRVKVIRNRGVGDYLWEAGIGGGQ